jgi:hypothetical protein
MVHLTPEQTDQLKHDSPPRVVVESKEYVLIPAEQYEKMRFLFRNEPEEIDPSFFEFTDIEPFDSRV